MLKKTDIMYGLDKGDENWRYTATIGAMASTFVALETMLSQLPVEEYVKRELSRQLYRHIYGDLERPLRDLMRLAAIGNAGTCWEDGVRALCDRINELMRWEP
jgi:hypothetical protein